MNAKYQTVRRITLTGKATDLKPIFNWLYKNGYHVTRTGPMILKKNFPYIEKDKFKIIGEKRIK